MDIDISLKPITTLPEVASMRMNKRRVGISESQLEELFNAAGHASAVIDPLNDTICWCSARWDSVFPAWSQGMSWSAILDFSEKLAELYCALGRQKSVSGTMADPLSEGLLEFHLFTMCEGYVGINAVSRPGIVDDMHIYMQAREHMFTTSRTISVSEMATTLAHEIKQPIATITNLMKGVRLRLGRGDLSTAPIKEAIDSALEQAYFTNSIINRIRDFTEARRPQQQLLDMTRLTREAMSLMDWFLGANHCRTELHVAQEPLYCRGDPTMLQQVFVNLLRNGVEAMQECPQSGRSLKVFCEQRGTYVRVSIRDSGHGLQGKEQSLYVPFSTSKANGMGVGLNICRSFVELHQGRLWLSPNADGGCTAHVELPIAPATQASSVHQSMESS